MSNTLLLSICYLWLVVGIAMGISIKSLIDEVKK